MPQNRHLLLLIALCYFLTFVTVRSAYATEKPGDVPSEAAILERLDEQIDLSLSFTNQHGAKVQLKDLFIDGRPLVIAPVYYECPRLCTLTQEGVVKSLNGLELKISDDFKVVSVSFDYEEPASLASERSKKYYDLLEDGEGGKNGGWDFLVGDKENISKLMGEIGFSFKEDQGEYIHAAILVVLTPEGKISRYLYGINYPSKDMRLALVEAAKGKIGNTLDRVFLYCFRFDPTKGKYTLAVWNVTRAFCSAGVLVLFGLLIRFRLKEKSKDIPE